MKPSLFVRRNIVTALALVGVFLALPHALIFAQGSGPAPLSNTISNPVKNPTMLAFFRTLLENTVNALIPILVLVYVIVGLLFITARGNPEKLAAAKRAFFYAVIVTVAVLGVWAIIQLITSTLGTLLG